MILRSHPFPSVSEVFFEKSDRLRFRLGGRREPRPGALAARFVFEDEKRLFEFLSLSRLPEEEFVPAPAFELDERHAAAEVAGEEALRVVFGACSVGERYREFFPVAASDRPALMDVDGDIVVGVDVGLRPAEVDPDALGDFRLPETGADALPRLPPRPLKEPPKRPPKPPKRPLKPPKRPLKPPKRPPRPRRPS